MYGNCHSRTFERASLMHEDPPVPALAETSISLAVDDLDREANSYAAASKALGTRVAYASDWRNFTAWCVAQGANPLPAESRIVGRYLTHLAGLGLSVSTINRRKAAIDSHHRAAGHENEKLPTKSVDVINILHGIRNSLGRPPKKVQALTVDMVSKVVRRIRGKSLMDLRDRALILLCFGAALRRSELVGLDVAHLEYHRLGLMLRLPRSKTDQSGHGQSIAVLDGTLKAPAAVRAWLDAAGITSGPVFRGCGRGRVSSRPLTAVQFVRILRKRCEAAGLDPKAIGGHSPRRGYATTAGDKGVDIRLTAKHMRHSRIDTTASYMEDGDRFRQNAGASFM